MAHETTYMYVQPESTCPLYVGTKTRLDSWSSRREKFDWYSLHYAIIWTRRISKLAHELKCSSQVNSCMYMYEGSWWIFIKVTLLAHVWVHVLSPHPFLLTPVWVYFQVMNPCTQCLYMKESLDEASSRLYFKSANCWVTHYAAAFVSAPMHCDIVCVCTSPCTTCDIKSTVYLKWGIDEQSWWRVVSQARCLLTCAIVENIYSWLARLDRQCTKCV